MIRCKVVAGKAKYTENEREFPFSPDELCKMINEDDPMPELNDTFYDPLPPLGRKNYGYVETSSKKLATKPWATAYDWQSLLTNERNVKCFLFVLFIGLTGKSSCLINFWRNSANFDQKKNHFYHFQ